MIGDSSADDVTAGGTAVTGLWEDSCATGVSPTRAKASDDTGSDGTGTSSIFEDGIESIRPDVSSNVVSVAGGAEVGGAVCVGSDGDCSTIGWGGNELAAVSAGGDSAKPGETMESVETIATEDCVSAGAGGGADDSAVFTASIGCAMTGVSSAGGCFASLDASETAGGAGGSVVADSLILGAAPISRGLASSVILGVAPDGISSHRLISFPGPADTLPT
ncbi:hypothetical protein KJ815_05600 [bacterium]|nr:hypothetical protein [bacterium]